MALADWELSYRGLTLGGEGTYALVSVEGLGMPAVRSGDRSRMLAHGQVPGADLLGGRTLTVEVEVAAADGAALSAAVEALSGALRPGGAELPLTFRLPGIAGGGERLVSARPRRLPVLVDADRWLHGLPVLACQFHATDPRVYDAAESSDATGLATAGGGLEFPATFPLVFGAVSTGGSITALNAGTFPTPVLWRIDGPATTPTIRRVSDGAHLTLNLTLADGDFITLDSAQRTVMLNGTASRYGQLTSDSAWFDLEPGETEVEFLATTPTTTTLTATWRSAWTT